VSFQVRGVSTFQTENEMESSMLDYLAIGISGLAVLISLLAYWRTSPLIRMQKESAKLDLEERRRTKLSIELQGSLDYKKPSNIIVRNTGAVDAYNVRIEVRSGEDAPEEIRDETNKSFPVAVLPSKHDVTGVVYLFGHRRLNYRLNWQDQESRDYTQSGLISL
jgi:ABC-type anion transport system duplicated permease subunit